MTKTTVMILAAGLGTRMRSKKAKVLHRAGGLAMVEHVVRAARAVAEPERIVVVTGHQADEVEKLLAPQGVQFVRQDAQKGTGHAVECCRAKLETLDGLLMVLYGDVPLLTAETVSRLRDVQEESGAAATVMTMTPDDPGAYGRMILNDRGDVTAIVEYKNATPEQRAIRVVNTGICCFRADLLWRHLGEVQPNELTGEYYLTDMAEILNRHRHRVASMHIEDLTEVLGINTRVELAEADRVLRDRKRRALMLDGVTIEQPETVTIDADVQVGHDTVIEPFARLLGATVIGEDCRIGAGAILESAAVENGALVHPYSVITQAKVGEGAWVGPFARLRPGAELGPRAEIGNFAEVKNTKIGEGAKSHHVSYLGDAEVGANVNIGAGTIICNYDGAKKHRTRIGSGVFVGSNSTLVAPVELGDGSYIAAGSVITHEVPPGALGVGRSRQVVKEGWAAKKKATKRE